MLDASISGQSLGKVDIQSRSPASFRRIKQTEKKLRKTFQIHIEGSVCFSLSTLMLLPISDQDQVILTSTHSIENQLILLLILKRMNIELKFLSCSFKFVPYLT